MLRTIIISAFLLTSMVNCRPGEEYLQQMWNNGNYRTHFYEMYQHDLLSKTELLDLLTYPYPAGGFSGQTYGQVIDQIQPGQQFQLENQILQPTDGVKVSLSESQQDTSGNYTYNIHITNNGDTDLTFLAATIVVKKSNYANDTKLGFTDFHTQFIKKGDKVTNTILVPENVMKDSIRINQATMLRITPEDHKVLITGVRITKVR